MEKCPSELKRHQENEIHGHIDYLPSEVQRYLEFTDIDNERLESLWESLITNQVQIASDGSHLPGIYQGAGAAIAADESPEKTLIWSGTKCDAEQGMISLTTEQYEPKS